MNVAFFGYRSWAIEILKNLLTHNSSEWHIKALFTTPNAEVPLNNFTVPVHTFDPASQHESIGQILTDLDIKVILFYGWSWIIPESIYSQYKSIILHPSPLPKYRGGSPLQHQIIAGEKESAVTLLKVGKGIDEGPIYSQTTISLSGTMNDIFGRIVSMGTKDTITVLNNLAQGDAATSPQDNSQATVYKRRKKEESEIKASDFSNKTSEELYNLIRALSDPYPNAYIVCKDGKKLFITGAKKEE